MRQFNVIIEDMGKFVPYDMMPYLKRVWDNFRKKAVKKQDKLEDGDYWKYPETKEEIRKWVEREIKYQYWARCEYEIILSSWPPRTEEKGKKIDIYEQCMMNIDLIVQLFTEDIYKPMKK